MLIKIGSAFPREWLWGKYEKDIIDSVCLQIDKRWPTSRNLFINTTWFGPTFDNGNYQRALGYSNQIDNLFMLASVDPMYIAPPDFKKFYTDMGCPALYKIGNYDDSLYEFNFFSIVLSDHFCTYSEDDLLPTEIKYRFINYNRKPRFHRVQLVKKIISSGLDRYGIQTLGKPDIIYDHDPENNLFLSIGEDVQDYVKHGHWFVGEDPTGIPHDVLSLHNMNYWQKHFLHIVSATMFWPWDDIFVSETQFKPIIGMRPFIINGNLRTYQWLRDRGFKTFNHWFPFADLDNTHEDSAHENILIVLDWLSKQSENYLMDMYHDMLPDLQHNRQRFFEFAKEQTQLIENLFDV